MMDSRQSAPIPFEHHDQVGRRFVRRLAAYLPVTLTHQILMQGLPAPGEASWLTAATIFADISGFTRMSEDLAADGPSGAEELNRALLMTFTSMINAIHDAGGAVTHFHGDAMLIYFPDDDGRAAERALASARFMQSLMLTSFSRMVAVRPSGKEKAFALTIKIGVGYGRCLQMIVGSEAAGLEFVLAGTAVTEAAQAQQQAGAGQVVAGRSVLQSVGLPVNGLFRVVEELAPVPRSYPLLHWDAFDQEAFARLAAVAPAFIPPGLYTRLQDQHNSSVGEHRPTTSLFVRFEGIDFEGPEAGERLQTYYTWAAGVVRRYGGTNSHLNRLLNGDKGSQLHIIFGAPVAPDAPEQAIRCALALQRERPSFIRKQQIGLVASRAFACAVGSLNRREYTVVGRGVNLSAHLTQICPDGAVVVDEATANRVNRSFTFERLQAVDVKGNGASILPYRVLAERQALTQLQARFGRWKTPPVGRRQEQAQLRQALARALTGRGQVVAVAGATGSGKARLMSVGVHEWLGAGGYGVLGVCQPHTREVPFGVWLPIWRELLGAQVGMPLLAQATAVQSHLEALDVGAAAIQVMLETLGLPVGVAQALPPAKRQGWLFGLALRLLQAAAARQPLLLVFEDIQWADQLSLDLLDEATGILAETRLALAVTYRPPVSFRCRALDRSSCTTVRLGDLPPHQARLLLKHLTGMDRLPVIVEERLGLRDPDGHTRAVNPLFLKESLKMMLSQGVLRLERDAQGTTRCRVDTRLLSKMQVPDSISTVMLAQLDQLSAAGRRLLQVAAVIGREFSLETLRTAVPDLTAAQVAGLLEELTTVGLLQVMATEPEVVYVFQHALVHEVVYQSLPYARRQAHHAAIADLLATQHEGNLHPVRALLAYHYTEAKQHKEGLAHALAAAEAAAAMFANREAAELYKLAQTHLAALGEGVRWRTAVQAAQARAEALRLLGRLEEAAVTAVEGLQICLAYGDAAESFPVYTVLTQVQFDRGLYGDVQQQVRRMLRSLPDRAPAAARAQVHQVAGMAARVTGEFETAVVHLSQAEALAMQAEADGLMAALRQERGRLAGARRRLSEALGLMQQARQQAEMLDLSMQVGSGLCDLAQVHLWLGQPQAALAAATEATRLLRGVSPYLYVGALLRKTAVWLYLGRWEAAAKELKQAESLLSGMDHPQGELELHLLWGEQRCRSGSWVEAQAHYEQAAQIVERLADGTAAYDEAQMRIWLGLAQFALQMKWSRQAETLLLQAQALAQKPALVWWRTAVLLLRGVARGQQAYPEEKEAEKVRLLLEKALASVGQGGNPDELPLILLQLSKWEQDEQKRDRYLAQCVQAARNRSRRADRAACLQAAGEALSKASDPALRQWGAVALSDAAVIEDETV